MSMTGIKKVAKILSEMQEVRGELLQSATGERIDKQDLKLAQLLEVAKDAIKQDFARITVE